MSQDDPGATAEIPSWGRRPDGTIDTRRTSEFWTPAAGGSVDCSLCYQNCRLQPGEAGPCAYRVNQGGEVRIPEHGRVVRASRSMVGYAGGLTTFHPGSPMIAIGGVMCTARCSFCVSGDSVWRPERVPWIGDEFEAPGVTGGWSGVRALLHPRNVIALAEQWGATVVNIAENEPLLSFEYTYDTARLAKEAGLAVVVYTNGFSSPAVIERLAPYVDAVDVGIKGSLDEDFYARFMRSPGATPAVRESILTWKRAGVPHLIVSDVLATPLQQPVAVAEAAQRDLYAWIATEVGPLTPLLIARMLRPGHLYREKSWDARWTGFEPMVTPGSAEYGRYVTSDAAALERASEAGLQYVLLPDTGEVSCHACGGVLVRLHPPTACWYTPCQLNSRFCDCWSHEQHVTDSRCDHCGAEVPVIVLPPAQVAGEQERAFALGLELALPSPRTDDRHQRLRLISRTESRPSMRSSAST